MKNLTTGETSGPPLPHEEWIANQRKLEEAEAKKLSRNVARSDDEPKHAGNAKK